MATSSDPNRISTWIQKGTRRGFVKRLAAVLAGGTFASGATVTAASISDKDQQGAPSYSPGGLEPFIGEISMFAGNFAPRGWAFCDGQMLPISQNSALFSILGTTYGGDGRTTFALPDLRGRAPLHRGQGPGLTDRPLGGKGGTESSTTDLSQFPVVEPDANGRDQGLVNGSSKLRRRTISPSTSTMPPYLAINYIIALQGIFPSRS